MLESRGYNGVVSFHFPVFSLILLIDIDIDIDIYIYTPYIYILCLYNRENACFLGKSFETLYDALIYRIPENLLLYLSF